MQLNRRHIRHTLGSRSTRRQGTKSRNTSAFRQSRPAKRVKQIVNRILSGEIQMKDV